MRTYREVLQTAQIMLKQQGITDADIDAWYLFSHVFRINRAAYLLSSESEANEENSARYMELVKLRASHIPLQHITGIQEFMGLEFEVSPDVLIPRQDTEILVEEVLKVCSGKTVLDMCTGSGCIIISIAKLGNPGIAAAADISEKALELARNNAARNQVNVDYVKSNLFNQIKGSFDIIVSNPPYIPTSDIQELMPEVKNHEPMIALDGRSDGLYFYREIINCLNQYLSKNGMIFFEIGYNQGKAVSELLQQQGFAEIVIKKDLSGLDRVISARRL